MVSFGSMIPPGSCKWFSQPYPRFLPEHQFLISFLASSNLSDVLSSALDS